jgi:hypothetical protein
VHLARANSSHTANDLSSVAGSRPRTKIEVSSLRKKPSQFLASMSLVEVGLRSGGVTKPVGYNNALILLPQPVDHLHRSLVNAREALRWGLAIKFTASL